MSATAASASAFASVVDDALAAGPRALNLARAAMRALELVGGATPHEVAWRSGPVALRRYRPARPAPGATPLVFVMPFLNRYRVVDLEPGTSLVGRLVERGLEVFLLDWGEPRRIDAGTDFEDYLLRHIPRAARAAAEAAGRPGAPVDLLGLCLGGTLATCFTALEPARVRRLATLVAPIDFSDMDLLSLWTGPGAFPVEALTRAFGCMPGALVNQGFQWQRPMSTATKYAKAWPRLDDAAFAGFFSVVESWSQDPVDVPGAAYRRLITALYRENQLAKGQLVLRPRRGEPRTVDLSRIACPVLVAAAQDDLICPPRASHALLERISTPVEQQRRIALKGGHITPLVGPKARKALQDPLADWLLG